MYYIILGCAIIVGIIVMIISYIITPSTVISKPSTKLVNTDVSLESAIKELELIDIITPKNNTSGTNH